MSEPIVRVRQVMKTDFDTVDSMATVYDALKSMRHIETKCLIVNKRHDDDEWGMVLASDIARQVIARDRSAERVNLYEIMTKPVLSVRSHMDVRYCARLFERFQLHCAPVVEDGEIVGIVTYTDIVLG